MIDLLDHGAEMDPPNDNVSPELCSNMKFKTDMKKVWPPIDLQTETELCSHSTVIY